jgi:hypothetical protein
MLRIVFSIASLPAASTTAIVSAPPKSRWKFYAQVQRLRFHTAWIKSGSRGFATGCLLDAGEQTLSA